MGGLYINLHSQCVHSLLSYPTMKQFSQGKTSRIKIEMYLKGKEKEISPRQQEKQLEEKTIYPKKWISFFLHKKKLR